jgi:hypothetical protein
VYPALSGLLGDYTDVDFANAKNQLHAILVSINDSRQRYEATHDARYLESIRTMQPYATAAFSKMSTIAAALNDDETPSQFAMVFADLSDWLSKQVDNVVGGVTGTVAALPKVASAIANPLVLLAIAGVAFLAFGGSALLPKRRK